MSTLIQNIVLLAVPTGAAAGAGAVAVHYRRRAAERLGVIRQLEGRVRDGEQRVSARDEEARNLAAQRLPALIVALSRGDGGRHRDAGLLHPQLADTETGAAYHAVLDQVAVLANEAAERAEGAARAAVEAVVRSMQSLINEQQVAVTALQDLQSDEKTLAITIPIDHASSQLARRAQIVGILTGMWPGRQRADTPLLETIRGGVSRIRDYPRVEITGEPTAYVAGRVVEPVVLAAAELLNNAAQHSHPGTKVYVWYLEGHNGISIVIEDAGIGMAPEERERAARLLSGQNPVRITELRTPPRFGFQAIGLLAARYGFTVSVEQQSVHGGVRAVLHLPRALLVTAPTHAPAPEPAAGYVPDASAPGGHPYPVAVEDGLPMRRGRRGSGLPAAAPATSVPRPGAGRGLAAFVRGTSSARPNSTNSTDQEQIS
ncbi:ATP-binding protein (plasmid) [Streptomyces sp. AM 4-1-1]|uniref:ATP-binding protein n=1 Tax=Streptomyces sp. AM 4-1-1 TaxID=3028710 RepID=UPI0023B92B93|nr:ATP-binding protein [Streptomyces sp. AM 4-1-1]WEH37876.1 ATP-binding protein [Streptomyces sp. AM 4-1-1]